MTHVFGSQKLVIFQGAYFRLRVRD